MAKACFCFVQGNAAKQDELKAADHSQLQRKIAGRERWRFVEYERWEAAEQERGREL